MLAAITHAYTREVNVRVIDPLVDLDAVEEHEDPARFYPYLVRVPLAVGIECCVAGYPLW
jgi:hypothetical protein